MQAAQGQVAGDITSLRLSLSIASSTVYPNISAHRALMYARTRPSQNIDAGNGTSRQGS
jgi:cell division FtsZ-interacting protein ZapD